MTATVRPRPIPLLVVLQIVPDPGQYLFVQEIFFPEVSLGLYQTVDVEHFHRRSLDRQRARSLLLAFCIEPIEILVRAARHASRDRRSDMAQHGVQSAPTTICLVRVQLDFGAFCSPTMRMTQV